MSSTLHIYGGFLPQVRVSLVLLSYITQFLVQEVHPVESYYAVHTSHPQMSWFSILVSIKPPSKSADS